MRDTEITNAAGPALESNGASKKGQAFTAAIWLVQLAVWGLATLALAGYTNLVRKPG